jgi:hypothetical protein
LSASASWAESPLFAAGARLFGASSAKPPAAGGCIDPLRSRLHADRL